MDLGGRHRSEHKWVPGGAKKLRYERLGKLGEGSYGQVFRVRDRETKEEYVCKTISLRDASGKEKRAARQEVQLLARLKHPNIVEYHDSFMDKDCLHIVMEHCTRGDLYSKCQSLEGYIDEEQILLWFVQIALALDYMHRHNVLHRDLKTQNIFLTETNVIKLGDFGIARMLIPEQGLVAETCIGTPYYMSPETLSKKPYGFASDVWSLGCVLFELASLRHAFRARDMTSLMFKVVSGRMPEMPSHFSLNLRKLVASMLAKNPEDRPTLPQILRLPFLQAQLRTIVLQYETGESELSASITPEGMRSLKVVRQAAQAGALANPAASATPSAPPLLPSDSRRLLKKERTHVESAIQAEEKERQRIQAALDRLKAGRKKRPVVNRAGGEPVIAKHSARANANAARTNARANARTNASPRPRGRKRGSAPSKGKKKSARRVTKKKKSTRKKRTTAKKKTAAPRPRHRGGKGAHKRAVSSPPGTLASAAAMASGKTPGSEGAADKKGGVVGLTRRRSQSRSRSRSRSPGASDDDGRSPRVATRPFPVSPAVVPRKSPGPGASPGLPPRNARDVVLQEKERQRRAREAERKRQLREARVGYAQERREAQARLRGEQQHSPVHASPRPSHRRSRSSQGNINIVNLDFGNKSPGPQRKAASRQGMLRSPSPSPRPGRSPSPRLSHPELCVSAHAPRHLPPLQRRHSEGETGHSSLSLSSSVEQTPETPPHKPEAVQETKRQLPALGAAPAAAVTATGLSVSASALVIPRVVVRESTRTEMGAEAFEVQHCDLGSGDASESLSSLSSLSSFSFSYSSSSGSGSGSSSGSASSAGSSLSTNSCASDFGSDGEDAEARLHRVQEAFHMTSRRLKQLQAYRQSVKNEEELASFIDVCRSYLSDDLSGAPTDKAVTPQLLGVDAEAGMLNSSETSLDEALAEARVQEEGSGGGEGSDGEGGYLASRQTALQEYVRRALGEDIGKAVFAEMLKLPPDVCAEITVPINAEMPSEATAITLRVVDACATNQAIVAPDTVLEALKQLVFLHLFVSA